MPTRVKPAKPYQDFPLFPHATGQWAKKIRGRMFYFGPWTDPQAALARYKAERDDLYAGRQPRADGVDVKELCNLFLKSKELLVRSGELSPRTWRDYHATCERLIEAFGPGRPVQDLAGQDLERHRARLARGRGAVALGNEVQRVRTILKYAYDERLIDAAVRLGSTFRKPSRKAMRAERQAGGEKMFAPNECRAIIDAATGPLKAMALLALNCGYGPADVGALPRAALDLIGGWATFPRPKTAMPRRAKLWPETVEALRAAIAVRPDPKDPADAGLAFVTKYGHRWARNNEAAGGRTATPIDAVNQEFRKLLTYLGLKRKGVGFYACRHTFRTVADAFGDQRAADYIMGHVPTHISAAYVERVGDERLERVAAYVRAWVWPDTGAPADTTSPKPQSRVSKKSEKTQR